MPYLLGSRSTAINIPVSAAVSSGSPATPHPTPNRAQPCRLGAFRVLPVARRSLRTGAGLREKLVRHIIIVKIGLVGSSHLIFDLFICEGFVASAQNTFPVQNFHGVEARNFEWKRSELIR